MAKPRKNSTQRKPTLYDVYCAGLHSEEMRIRDEDNHLVDVYHVHDVVDVLVEDSHGNRRPCPVLILSIHKHKTKKGKYVFKGAWYQSKQDILSEAEAIRASVEGTAEGRQLLAHMGQYEVVLSNYTQYFDQDMVEGFSTMITFLPQVGTPFPPTMEPCLFWMERYWEYDCRTQTSTFVSSWSVCEGHRSQCTKQYAPDTDVLRFCERCTTWYHSRCLKKRVQQAHSPYKVPLTRGVASIHKEYNLLVPLKDFPVTFEMMAETDRCPLSGDFQENVRQAVMEKSGMQHLTKDVLTLMVDEYKRTRGGFIWFHCPQCPEEYI